MSIRLALDQNFPTTALDFCRQNLPEAELVHLPDIDSALSVLDDPDLVLEVFARGWDGLVTTDDKMLVIPETLAVIHQTGMKIIAADQAGHDPLRAAGLLFLHLPQICKRFVPNKAQVWHLKANVPPSEDPWDRLTLRRVEEEEHRAQPPLSAEQTLGR